MGKYRRLTGCLLGAAVLALAGCGTEGGAGQTLEAGQPETQENGAEAQQAEAPENTAGEQPDASAEAGENAADSGQDGNAEAQEETLSPEKVQELQKAQIRHYYGGILSQIIAAWQLPDGEWDSSSLSEGFGEMRDNRFAVTDIDGDGREELIVCNENATMAGMVEIIYDYDPVLGQLKREFESWPSLTYYDNGIIKAEASHNHTHGEFWPFALYQYETESDSYKQIAYVHTWDKELYDVYEGQPFPEELDTDGDGTLFNISEGGEPSYEYENYKYNQADYEEWYHGMMEGAKEIKVPYQPMEYESFADFTPAYLKLLAEEAGKERTDTDADLGLLLLQEDHFLDAAKTLLSEKYGVELKQPDLDYEELTNGYKEGEGRFTFEEHNGGFLGYKGEKVEDVTIFGIYPGISVDGAWEKLKAYGFYASPYGEIENCLVTGEGFGNISVWFQAEDNRVTGITVSPYCAFAG